MGEDDSRRRHARLRVAVSDEYGRLLPVRLARWLSAIAPSRARGLVNVAVISDARARALNRCYRGIDRATDVLSFPSTGQLPGSPVALRRRRRSRRGFSGLDRVSANAPEARFLGDIVIARGVARRQARAAGHDETTEIRVLALHGLLHLLGYDHDRDAGTMARLERRLRRKGGLREGLIERQ
jgi:probable rRNA maturation factor